MEPNAGVHLLIKISMHWICTGKSIVSFYAWLDFSFSNYFKKDILASLCKSCMTQNNFFSFQFFRSLVKIISCGDSRCQTIGLPILLTKLDCILSWMLRNIGTNLCFKWRMCHWSSLTFCNFRSVIAVLYFLCSNFYNIEM